MDLSTLFTVPVNFVSVIASVRLGNRKKTYPFHFTFCIQRFDYRERFNWLAQINYERRRKMPQFGDTEIQNEGIEYREECTSDTMHNNEERCAI